MQQIECYNNNCMIYRGDDIDLQESKFYHHPRYKECMNESINKVVRRPIKKIFLFSFNPKITKVICIERHDKAYEVVSRT